MEKVRAWDSQSRQRNEAVQYGIMLVLDAALARCPRNKRAGHKLLHRLWLPAVPLHGLQALA